MKTSKRDSYIVMRNSQKLDNNWLCEYYKQEGGKIANVNEFLENFYIVQEPIILHGVTVGHQRGNRDLSNFFQDMDKKMELTTLWEEPTIERDAFGKEVRIEKFIKVV